MVPDVAVLTAAGYRCDENKKTGIDPNPVE